VNAIDSDQALPESELVPTSLVRLHIQEGPHVADDILAREEPLEIRVRGRSIAVIMRTPGHDHELATGFLLGEALIRERTDILDLCHCRQGEAAQYQNILNVFLAPTREIDFEKLARNVYASSSCGLCGKSSIESVHQHFPPVRCENTFAAEVLVRLPDRMRAAQTSFSKAGALHAAALFNESGELFALREDVGRHNAVDKVIGHALLAGRLPLDGHILMVSGRASFEIMQKALAARVPVIAAVSGPSSLAVDFARESRQTLIGFLRGQSMNIYSEPQRIR
jgi:FdhD protein